MMATIDTIALAKLTNNRTPPRNKYTQTVEQ